MVQQTEVGVQDFVLLDEITLERFMDNLHTRWVDRTVVGSIFTPIPCALCAEAVVCWFSVRVFKFFFFVFSVGILSSELSETNRPT